VLIGSKLKAKVYPKRFLETAPPPYSKPTKFNGLYIRGEGVVFEQALMFFEEA